MEYLPSYFACKHVLCLNGLLVRIIRVLTYHQIIDFFAGARKTRAARLTLRISQSAHRFIVFFSNNQLDERSSVFSGDPNT